MTTPVVVSFEDLEPSQDVLDFALRAAEKVSTLKASAGVSQLVKSFVADDGSQVFVYDLDHVRKVHIIPPSPSFRPEVVLRTYEYPSYPSAATIAGVLSGATTTSRMDYIDPVWCCWPEEGGALAGQPSKDGPMLALRQSKLNLTSESARYFSKPEAGYKLSVETDSTYLSTLGLPSDLYPESQIGRVQPGYFTGVMRSVVQLLLGVGRVVIPDYESRWRRANPSKSATTPQLRGEITLRSDDDLVIYKQKLSDTPRNFEVTQREDKQFPIKYRFDWGRTHGVMWGRRRYRGNGHTPESLMDASGRELEPMLVEIGQRGVYVMPFPRDAISMSYEGRQIYEKVYPDLAKYPIVNDKTLFDAFGGFPLPDTFPSSTEELDRLVKAGFVVKADIDMSLFYDGANSFCTLHGWAFSDTLNEAANICYKFINGEKHSFLYKINVDCIERSSPVRNSYYSELVSKLGLTDPIDLYKARRLPDSVAKVILESGSYAAFNAAEAVADWVVRAKLWLVKKGRIDSKYRTCGRLYPCLPLRYGQFKVYEPLLKCYIDFDFYNEDFKNSTFVSDGPIFVCYVGDALEVLSFYENNTDRIETKTIDTRQPCQFVGEWQYGHTNMGSAYRGRFYTSTYDPRRRVRLESHITTVQGEIIGDADFMSFCHLVGTGFEVTKHYFGTETYRSVLVRGESFSTSVACAANDRSVFFMVEEFSTSGETVSEGFSGRKLIGASPIYLTGQIYNFVFHWFRCGVGTPDGCVAIQTGQFGSADGSCFEGIPSFPFYSVCSSPSGEIIVHSPANNSVIQSAYITNVPKAPPAWDRTYPTRYSGMYAVRGFGHLLMHNKIIYRFSYSSTNEGEYEFPVSNPDWWRCSVFDTCPVPAWRVRANYYGPEYIACVTEFDMGEFVQYGKPPEVDGLYFFGVVP